MFMDPVYGLNNITNYEDQWDSLRKDSPVLERLAFKAELKTYFGLTFEQVDELEASWNYWYNGIQEEIMDLLPEGAPRTVDSVAYYQWASSLFTADDGLEKPALSVDLLKGFAHKGEGHLEMNYFLDQKVRLATLSFAND